MRDTNVSEEVMTTEKADATEETNKSVAENSNFKMKPKQSSSGGIQDTTSKASDIKEVSEKSDILHTSMNTEAVAEPNQEDEDGDQYHEIEEEYEEHYEENGKTKMVLKKRIVKVKRSISLKSKEILSEEEVGEEKLIEKEGFEGEKIGRTIEMRTSRESHLIEETAKKLNKAIEEVYDENDDSVSGAKKSNISIYKPTTEGHQERNEGSEIEKKLTGEEIARELGEEEKTEEEEIEGEGTIGGEIKEEGSGKIGVSEEMEEAEEKETRSESERKSAASLNSREKLRAEEKMAMAQQYELLTKLRNEHIALRRKNLFLNNKLVQYFRKQKMDHVFAETKEDIALEQQYLKKLALFCETNKQMSEEKLKINTEWEAQRNINEALLEKVKKGWDELFSRKKEIATKLIDPKTGRTVPCDKTIEDLLNRQEAQMKLISECRLAQIKLKRRIEEKKLERQMHHAGKEFNLMDYEKLSSLKEYYVDKITERDIEIEEVNQKMIVLDNTLIQLKEQLQKKEEELEQEQERLQTITLVLNNKRANLNVLKIARHKTEKNTARIKQQSGLLAYPILLRDYEEKTQQLQLLMSEIEELKQAHRSSIIRIRKLRETVKRRGRERESHGVSGSTVTTSNDKSIF